MEEIKHVKRKRMFFIAIIFVLLIAIIGVTFSYFTNLSVTERQNVDVGYFSIAYNDVSSINLNNAHPILESEIFEKAAKIEFNVTNDGDYDGYLRLDMIDINMTANLGTNSLYWALYQGDTLINKGNFGCGKALINEKNTILKSAELKKGAINTYQLYVYILETNTDQSSMMNGSLSAKIEASATDIEVAQTYNQLSVEGVVCPNPPDLLDNTLLAVTYNEQESTWVKADTTSAWYDYSNQKWANAVTVSSSTRSTYMDATPGTPISMNDIETMWVWIPRYKYRINGTYGTHLDGTAGTKALPGAIDILFESETESTGVSGVSSTAGKTDYYTHPAFRNGVNVYKNEPYDLGGWDNELTGIWIAKFEMSSDCLNNNDTKSTTNCTSYGGGNTIDEKILIKPNMRPWTYNTTVNYFITSRTLSTNNDTYGISTNANSHLIKNTEWGAVAYLSQSKYGKYGNTKYADSDKEIMGNNCSKRLTGIGADSKNALESTTTCTTNTYETLKGQAASTTGNIYGIYDMSGGTSEDVMGNYNNIVSSSGFDSTWFSNNAKYYDKYTSNNEVTGHIKGDATYETKNWYGDKYDFVDYRDVTNGDKSWFFRGGLGYAGVSGIFDTEAACSGGSPWGSSRISLVRD